MTPKIELKNIKVYTSMSEETHCYEATLYTNGKKLGRVSNSGRGGADSFDGHYSHILDLDDQLGESSVEEICCEIVNDFLMVKEVRKLTKGRTAFSDGVKIYTSKATPEAVKKRYPNAIIINGLPDAEAVAILRNAA
jgi:exopolysaccharide biosynthesis protein